MSPNPADLARYVMKNTDWVSLATISTIPKIEGYPFVNVKSTSDRISGRSTGIPYFFLNDMDLSVIDVQEDRRISVMSVLTEYRKNGKKLNAQDPRCPRLMLTGLFEKVEDLEEIELAKSGLLEKHPVMKEWDNVHDFYIAKLNIEQVIFLGSFGGAEHISIEDYLAANPDADVKC